MIFAVVAIVLSLIWTVGYYGTKIYNRRWLESFIDASGIVPWPVLISLAFFFIAGLAKIWSPESDTARRWANAGLIQGSVALMLAWFFRAVLWAAPDSLWAENANVGKPANPPKPEPEEKK